MGVGGFAQIFVHSWPPWLPLLCPVAARDSVLEAALLHVCIVAHCYLVLYDYVSRIFRYQS